MTPSMDIQSPARSEASIAIEQVSPEVDGGLFPAKGIAGEVFSVEADIFSGGASALGACVKYKLAGAAHWLSAPMHPAGNDRWAGSFTPSRPQRWLYTIEAWVDETATWTESVRKKCLLAAEAREEIWEGIRLLELIGKGAREFEKKNVKLLCSLLRLSDGASHELLRIITSPNFTQLLLRYPVRGPRREFERHLALDVAPKCAQFGAWYALFPRSQGRTLKRHGTFRDCIARLPDIKKMGFDVINLTPIHPIGKTSRKGPNNSLSASPDDPGSPWAVGGAEGAHKDIHPQLGTLKDFKAFAARAKEYGIQIALDLAFQCSPDHPYVRSHPEWFYRLGDGTFRSGENPPYKYQDVYPLNFYSRNARSLWREMKGIVLFWIHQGVKIFRVESPHTKPLRFWHWLISEIRRSHPEIIFLSAAFTRPKLMKYLAKAGFSQSVTYFTWRNTKWELRQYLEELTQTDMRHYFRGHLFANTPDILPDYLARGGRPAFQVRVLLAATLSSSYGITSGFELCENTPLREGSEEYLDSEKYEVKVRNWNQEGNIKAWIGRINIVRRENPALSCYDNLRFYDTLSDHILAYGKDVPNGSGPIIVVVNLDPFQAHEDLVTLPIEQFGIRDWETYRMRDLITGEKYYWKGRTNYVRLDPAREPAHIFRLEK